MKVKPTQTRDGLCRSPVIIVNRRHGNENIKKNTEFLKQNNNSSRGLSRLSLFNFVMSLRCTDWPPWKGKRSVDRSSGSLNRLPDFDIFETAGEWGITRLAKTVRIGINVRKALSDRTMDWLSPTNSLPLLHHFDLKFSVFATSLFRE